MVRCTIQRPYVRNVEHFNVYGDTFSVFISSMARGENKLPTPPSRLPIPEVVVHQPKDWHADYNLRAVPCHNIDTPVYALSLTSRVHILLIRSYAFILKTKTKCRIAFRLRHERNNVRVAIQIYRSRHIVRTGSNLDRLRPIIIINR